MYHHTQSAVERRCISDEGGGLRRMAVKKRPAERGGILVERVQTGIRLEKRLLKVLKGLAEYHDMTLGDLLEGIVLHAFDGKHPFGEETRHRIADLKRIYRLDLDSSASHRLLEETPGGEAKATAKRARKRSKR
jgi:predicted DNA-binding ribbon-helix-helix protein